MSAIGAWMAEHFGTPEERLDALLPLLREREGVTRMEASYSGGNDEGGTDEIFLIRGDQREKFDGPWDDPLHRAVDELLSTKFGTWAGEWEANGYLYVTLDPPAAWTEGVMMISEGDEDPLGVGAYEAAQESWENR